MKLQELAVANPIQQAAKVFESYFGNRVDFNTVSKGQARDMLKRVRGLIAEHRRTPEFHRSERNPSYLKLVMMEQALAATAAATVPGAAPAANPQAQAGMQAAQIQQKKKQIQDAIKAKQGEIAQLQKQMNDPTMMAMAEGSGQFYVYHKVKGDRAGGADYDLLKTFPDKDSAVAFAQTYNNKISADKKNFHSAVVRTKSVKKDMAEGRHTRRLREASEIQQAQVVLASQDMVDQVQKMSEQVSAMQFKDLPALLDQIRNEVGVDQATQYNADASAALSGLLGNLQGAKQQLEAALGVITGQAPQVPGADMSAAPDMGAEMPAPGEEETADLDAAGADLDAAAAQAGLGRERR